MYQLTQTWCTVRAAHSPSQPLYPALALAAKVVAPRTGKGDIFICTASLPRPLQELPFGETVSPDLLIYIGMTEDQVGWEGRS